MHSPKIASAALSIGFGIASLGSLWVAPASATVIDPSTLHIGNGVTGTCPTGGCPIFNQQLTGGGTAEINSFTTSLDLYQNSSGQSASLTAPMLMIFAVPNGTSTSMGASSLSNAKYFDPYNAASGTPITFTFGTTAFSLNGSGFEGFMSDGEIYAFLANIASDPNQQDLFNGANSSNSFQNWHDADAHLSAATGGADPNINATEFAIFVYSFNTTFGPNDAINVDLNGVPTGTFVVGYGEANYGNTNPNPFTSPFTEAGLETGRSGGGGGQNEVPEPASLILLGTALMGLGILSRRRRRV